MSIFYRFQQFTIFILHFVLLYWIYFALSESGRMTTLEVLLHFLGMATFGALLIRGCAAWAKWHHEQELKK